MKVAHKVRRKCFKGLSRKDWNWKIYFITVKSDEVKKNGTLAFVESERVLHWITSCVFHQLLITCKRPRPAVLRIYYGPGVARMIRDGLIIQGVGGWNLHPSTSSKCPSVLVWWDELITVRLYQRCVVFLSPRLVKGDNQTICENLSGMDWQSDLWKPVRDGLAEWLWKPVRDGLTE